MIPSRSRPALYESLGQIAYSTHQSKGLPMRRTSFIILWLSLSLTVITTTATAEELSQLIYTAQNGETGEERLEAVMKLAQYDDELATTTLIDRLWDVNEEVRLASAEALDARGWEPPTAPVMAQYLIAKKEWEKIPPLGDAALPSLIKALKLPQYDVRKGACWALGEVGNTEVLDYLNDIYRHDENPGVRMEAKKAMEKIQAKILSEKREDDEQPILLYILISAIALLVIFMLVSLLRSKKR